MVSVFTVFDDPEMFDGLVLIASWATESKSLKDWSGEVLSIYGSKDGLATVEEIEENNPSTALCQNTTTDGGNRQAQNARDEIQRNQLQADAEEMCSQRNAQQNGHEH